MNLTLRVSKISKNYNGVSVLKECSFLFDRKGVYVLRGPNGSGKSTLLRLCALLERPDGGEVRFSSEGQVVDHDMRLRRQITLVLPRPGVFNTTVFRNIAYGLKIRGIMGSEIRKRVQEVLESFGLVHKKSQNARTLSSGEIQRLGIARAVVLNPDILFLDEPTAYVDQRSREIIEEMIVCMKQEKKSIVIMATHDLSQAGKFAERVIVMEEGRIAEA